MATPQRKSWYRGRMYLAISDSAAATPITEPVDYSYDMGQNLEDMPYAGASVTPGAVMLSKPTLQINFNRRADGAVIYQAARHVRDNGTDVRWYLYLDATNEATVYAYGMGNLTLSHQGGASAGMKGSFSLTAGDNCIWDDHLLVV